jgi:SpoVK/Ycf46/Vps4 family AAA+-type ATPase
MRDRLLALGSDPDGRGALRAEADARRAMLEQRWRRLETSQADLAVHALRARLSLTLLEEEILWLAVGSATDPDLSALIAAAQSPLAEARPTPWLIQRLLEGQAEQRLDALAAVDATGALSRAGLLNWPTQGGPREPLARPFQAAPFVISFLLGELRVDERLAFTASLATSDVTLDQVSLPHDGVTALRELAALLARSQRFDAPALGFRPPRASLALLAGARGSGKSLVARALAGEAGVPLLEIDANVVEGLNPADSLNCLATAFQQAALTGAWLLLDGAERLLRDASSDVPSGERTSVSGGFRRLLDEHEVVVLITAESPDALGVAVRDRVLLQHELRPQDRRLAAFTWELNVPASVELARDVDFAALADAWPLSGRGIQNALRVAGLAARDGVVDHEALRLGASTQQLRGLGSGARRTWIQRDRADLVLAEPLARQIDEIVATERVRETVQQRWGLGQRLQKGLGIVCLFDGDPGTGKTLAAEVIASELALPLYTVNVSQVVSKWIGETEKNLQRIFDEARAGRCVLLFDEADMLFSKRTEVQRSVDRYANMEVGLLLQLVENHPGLAILTTNLKDSIDVAFQRRLTFKVSFTPPDAAARALIWLRVLPEGHLAPDVDVDGLAREFELAGGSIRTIALRAAYRAAMADGAITSAMLRDLALHELKALGKLVRETPGAGTARTPTRP